MSSMTFNQKTFTPKAPIKGSFPLDHEGECKKEMLEYLLCMNRSKSDNSACRDQAKDYLQCRINNKLMDRHDLEMFGYGKQTEQQQQHQQQQPLKHN